MPDPADATRQLCVELAHQALTELARRALRPGELVSHLATDQDAGLQALVILSPCAPWRLTDAERAVLFGQLERLGGVTSQARPTHVPAVPRPLSEMDRQILALLGRAGPLKGSTVARRLGRGYPYVRKRLAALVAGGHLHHVHGEGYAVTSR